MCKIKLYNGDCLEVMKHLIDNGIRVDAIITDPPYGTTACKWDSVIPFNAMWALLKALRKDTTPIVLFGSEPFASALRLSNIDEFREDLVWLKNKAASGLRSKQAHLKIHENINVFAKTGFYTFNPQKWLVDKKEFLTQRKTFKETVVGNQIYGAMKRTPKVDTGERNPISILSCRVPFTPQNRANYRDIDIRFHPTQKPLTLMEYLVKTYSNVGDTVLDFTMGSGTTGVACKNLGRNFIGIEIQKDYYDIAHNRIKETIDNLKNK